MQLFERIRLISKKKKISLTRIAAYLGYSQQNFQGYLNEKRQRRLYDHLPKIMELFPDVRPEWLYMGQEPVFKSEETDRGGPLQEENAALRARVAELEAELREADKLNRVLTTRLFVEGTGDSTARTDTGRVADGQG